MKRKTKIIVALISLFILLYGVLYNITEINKEQRIKIALDSHLDKLEIQYNTLIHHWRLTAKGAYKSTTNIPKVIDIFNKVQIANKLEKEILRKKLYKIMLNKYKSLKTKGVSAYSFVLSDKTAFLRLNTPTRFGDDVSSHYRVEYVTKFKKSIYGYEKGRMSPSFRNAFPIFSKPSKTIKEKNDNYLGMLVISFSSDKIEEYLSDVSKIDTYLLIHKNIFYKKNKQEKDFLNRYTQSNEHIDYLTTNINTTEYIKKDEQIKKQIYVNINKGNKFSLYSIHNDKATILSFYPIKNIKDKKTVAWIVSSENDTFIDMTLEGNIFIHKVSFFIFILFFYFVYRVINQKEILDIQVKEKTQILAKINIALNEREDELKSINKHLKKTIKKEVRKNQDKDRLVFQQSKMVSMGEMIGNIAHQWRQPLSVISTASTGIIMQKQFGVLDEKKLIDTCNSINDNAQYLSKTIDDFKNFIKGDRDKKIFNLKGDINSFLHLVEGSIKSHNINIILDLEENIKIDGYENELIQCLINIFNNAKDVLKEKVEENRLIFISTFTIKDKAVIKIKDNGRGIPEDILHKIFEPYFTTKHQSQGTGLGLHMTYNLIVDGMDGTIEVDNKTYIYEGKEYIGAEFTIILPV